jgi:predicted ATPase
VLQIPTGLALLYNGEEDLSFSRQLSQADSVQAVINDVAEEVINIHSYISLQSFLS